MPSIRIEMRGGEIRSVNQAGQITTAKWPTPSDTWTLLGFTRRWNARHIEWSPAEIFASPEGFKAWIGSGPVYGWDLDHGTTRRWANPAIRSVRLVSP